MWTSSTLLAILWMAVRSCCASNCPAGWNKLPQPIEDEEFRQAPQYFVNSAFPQFAQHPTGGTFIEGTPVSLRCALDVSAPGLQLVWVVNDTGVIECPVKSNCVVSNDSETASTLWLRSFSAGMEGTYQCVAKNGNYTVTSNAARIIRPTFFGWLDPFPQDPIRKAQNGSTVVLVCNPNATAAVDLITWVIGGNYSSDNSSVALQVRYGDPGSAVIQQVFCTVTFGDNLQAQTRKFILEPSSEQLSKIPPRFTVTPENITVPTGGRVMLFCIAEGNPWPVISWHKDGVLLRNAHDQVLSLSKATPEMSGAYTCVASNGGSSDVSTTALVRVQAPPGAAAIRSVSTYDQNGSDIFLPSLPADPQSLWTTLHLECGAQFSTAEAEFRWLFRGRPASVTAPGFVQTNDDRLLMSAPSVSELVGSVQCLVVTAAGTSFASARILISGKPNYPQLYRHSRSYFQYSFSWVPPTPATAIPPVSSYVVQVLAWQQDFMVCEREAFDTSMDLDAILFEDEIIRTRVAAKSGSGVLSDFVPDGGISVSRVQPPPPSDLQCSTSESGLGYQVSLGWTLPPSSVYPSSSYSVVVDLECMGVTPLQVKQNDFKKDSIMTYTRNISCCSNCSWSVVLTPVTTQPVVSTASSAFQTSSIATSSPPTLTSLQWHDTNGTSISVSIMLPVPTVLCHCSGPLVINVSYSNETSTFYTNFVLLEYRSDVTSYDRTLILDKAECWRQYNVSVAYQSPTGRALFSRAITLDNSELSVALSSSSVAVQLKPQGAVDCLFRTKMGTFQLSYYQLATISQGFGRQANLSSSYLVLEGLTGNASVSVNLNVTIGKRTRLLGLVLQLEPSTVIVTSPTSDLEVTSLTEKGMIIGIVTGVCVIVAVVVVGVVLFVCMYLARRYLKSRSRQQQRDEEVQIIAQAVLQPQQHPEMTNLVDTECHSIASTEATHLDRIAAYIRDVDTYGKSAPDGDVDNSMMEDPLVPGCDDLQSVTDDRDVGVGLNRAGSVLSSQPCDALELESLTPEPDKDYITLHSQTETRHLLDNSPPAPRIKTKLKTKKTKAPGTHSTELIGRGNEAKIEMQGSFMKSQHPGRAGSKPRQMDATAQRPQTHRPCKVDVEPPQEGGLGRNTLDPDQQSFVDVSLSSDDKHSRCMQQLYSEKERLLRGVSQGYVPNPSPPYREPGTDVPGSRMGHARPGDPTANADYNRPVNQLTRSGDLLGQMDSQQHIRETYGAQPHDTGQPRGTTCHRDALPADGCVANQWRAGDYSDHLATTAPCSHVNGFDSTVSPRGPYCSCNSSSSSSSRHYHIDKHHANPRWPPNNQSFLLQEEYLPSQPRNMALPNGSYPAGSSSSNCHCSPGNPDTRCYHITQACYGDAGRLTGAYPQATAGHHLGPPEAVGPPGGCTAGCQGGNQHNCSRQHQPLWEAENTGHHSPTCYCACRARAMVPKDSVESSRGHMTSHSGHMTSRSGHMTSHSGHMTSHSGHMTHVIPNPDDISRLELRQYQHQHHATNCNQLCSHQTDMSSQHPNHPRANTPTVTRHQPEIVTPPGPSHHPVQQLQQAEDLSRVAVFIPKSPKYPYPMGPSPLPPSAHPAVPTLQNNKDKLDGYLGVGVLSNPNANLPNYVTLPSSGHANTTSHVRRDIGPSSEHIKPISTQDVYTNSERTQCLYEAEGEEISHLIPSNSSSNHPAHNSVTMAKLPCIPSLLRQINN